MTTLANILAGVQASPYRQQSQGINPLLQQFMLRQQLMQQLGGGGGQQQMPPQQPLPGGLGSMGAAAQPMLPQQQTAQALPQIAGGLY